MNGPAAYNRDQAESATVGLIDSGGWLGVRCSTQADADERVPELLRQDARRFVLLTPREEVDIRDYLKAPWMPDRIVKPGSIPIEHVEVRGLDLVIVQGGDTPLHPAWVRSIRDQCVAAVVPFYFAGWGEWDIGGAGAVLFGDDGTFCPTEGNVMCTREEAGHLHTFVSRVGADKSGRLLDGREWLELPGEATP